MAGLGFFSGFDKKGDLGIIDGRALMTENKFIEKWMPLRYALIESGWICLKWCRKVAQEETAVREKSGN